MPTEVRTAVRCSHTNSVSTGATSSGATQRRGSRLGCSTQATTEGFRSIVKRGIIGTFHKVSKKYLHLYVNEFEFRYNNRMNADIFGAAIKAC